MMLVTVLCSVPLSALLQPQVGWRAARFMHNSSCSSSLPREAVLTFFYSPLLPPTILITLTLACLATEDIPGSTKKDLSSMIAQGISGLMRPLLSGLKVSKTHFVYFCEVTGQNCLRSKQTSRRGFSSTCKLQCSPGESRWVKSLPYPYIAELRSTFSEGKCIELYLGPHRRKLVQSMICKGEADKAT